MESWGKSWGILLRFSSCSSSAKRWGRAFTCYFVFGTVSPIKVWVSSNGRQDVSPKKCQMNLTLILCLRVNRHWWDVRPLVGLTILWRVHENVKRIWCFLNNFVRYFTRLTILRSHLVISWILVKRISWSLVICHDLSSNVPLVMPLKCKEMQRNANASGTSFALNCVPSERPRRSMFSVLPLHNIPRLRAFSDYQLQAVDFPIWIEVSCSHHGLSVPIALATVDSIATVSPNARC